MRRTTPARLFAEADVSLTELKTVVRAAERFAVAVEARAMALMAQLDLTMPQLRAVLFLRQRGRANGRQLATALRVTPGAVVGICDHLEERGYLRRSTDPDDRRITWFELTDQGAAAFRGFTKTLARARVKALIAGLGRSERAGFVKVADAFADALSTASGADTDAQA